MKDNKILDWKPLLLVMFWLVLSKDFVQAQEKQSWLNRTLHKLIVDTSSAETQSFRVYPTLGYSPETSFEFGFSSLFLFRAKNDSANRLSEVNAFTFITLEKQYGLWVDNAIYLDKDSWFFLGRSRLQRFPLLYYGIGPHTTDNAAAVIEADYLLLRQRAMRKLIPNLFLGPEFDLQRLTRTRFVQPDSYTYPLPTGSDGTTNLGLGAALVYDNRHNVLNVRKGIFGELSFLQYSRSLASDYNFSGVYADVRSYHPLQKNQVLAWQVTGNFMSGTVPFNQLALMGGDMMMRGYYQGRYRDKNLLAAQTEYRLLPFPFSKRIGGTVFTGVAAVAPTIGSLQWNNLRVAGGAGLRYLLFPKKDIFLRLDVGFTRDGPGFYIYTGEAF